MNNIEEVVQVIAIGLAVATFLLNTGNVLKAIELCKESLVLLNNKAPSIKKELSNFIYGKIYYLLINACSRIRDNTNVIAYGRKLLAILRERGETVGEGELSMDLGKIYWNQSRYDEAREMYERAATIMKETGNKKDEAVACENLGVVLQFLGENDKAKKYYERALAISLEIGDKKGEAACYGSQGCVSQFLGEYVKAKEYHEKALVIRLEIGDREGEATDYGNLGCVSQSLSEYVKAKGYHEKELVIRLEIGDREGEGRCYGTLGCVSRSLGEYVKAKEYYEKALAITLEIGDKEGEGRCYGHLGYVSRSLGEYVKAKEYLEKALSIRLEIGDRKGEAMDYGNLGCVSQSLGEYVKAKEYHERALSISLEIGDKKGEAADYGNLGCVSKSLGEYVKAKEYHEKALSIRLEIGDREGEASDYGNLGCVSQSLGEYVKAKGYHEKELVIRLEIGNRAGEGNCYGKLGVVFQSLGEYVKAEEYYEKALAIRSEIGDRNGEAADYRNLGSVSQTLGEYVKAVEYHEKALAIRLEIGDRAGEAVSYQLLGNVFGSLDEYEKAKEYYEKALVIHLETGARAEVAIAYRNLGTIFQCLRKYRESKQCYDKALGIFTEIGARAGEAGTYAGLADLFHSLGDLETAEEYFEKGLPITIEIGDREGEANNYRKLGIVHLELKNSEMADDYLQKALGISKDIRDCENEIWCYCYLSLTKLIQGKSQEASSYLFKNLEKCEHLRGFLRDSDEFKIYFSDKYEIPYKLFSGLLCSAGYSNIALHVVELGRARALADLMATQYSTEAHISANPKSWIGFEHVIEKERDCTCLYISYDEQRVFLWVLKTSGAIHFRKFEVDEETLYKRLPEIAVNLDEFFYIMADSFRSFGILPEEVCEDGSSSATDPKPDSSQEENLAVLRQGEEEEDPKPSLALFYEMLIDPVSEFLKEPEIIIVPDRNLYRVPFPALRDINGKYLSESFRIRVVPSLMTLKLIQDSPADYHSQTGALIVGDPKVGRVRFQGRVKTFKPLPGARNEAEMIGRLLGVQPLLGEHATKQAVLERIKSASLIHFAAHGNPQRGEIALAPPASVTEVPREDDYLLKMSDISKVQLRAKLVVLSCCHSGRGQIRAEGVVGIARAFLGSGARSVLVSLWALDDTATEQLMSRFYEHLVRGEKVSECLHEAMKWMRDKGFSDVKQWAPLMLIGDNVTFDFGKKMVMKEAKTLSAEDLGNTESKE